jgi:hypothetical protein
MNINRNNFEIYCIDYYDGSLTPEQVAELFLFLEQNPDLKAEFDSFSGVSLPVIDETFSAAESLKRGDISSDNISWYLAASAEGDLSETEEQKLAKFLQDNPSFEKDRKLFSMARLDASHIVEYPAKAELKRPEGRVIVFSTAFRYAAAAVIILTLFGGSFLMLTRTIETNPQQVAENPAVTPDTTSGLEAEAESHTPAPLDVQKQMTPPVNRSLASDNKSTEKSIMPVANIDKTIQPMVAEVQPLPVRDAGVLNTTEPLKQVENRQSIIEQEQQPVAQNTSSSYSNSSNTSEYVSVWEAIRQGAENNLKKFAGTEENTLAALEEGRGNNVKLMDVVSRGIEKVSNEKVQVNTKYNDQGRLSAFRFKAGGFGIERTGRE